jgi:tryptophan 2,3-dioxygenase
MIGSIHFISRHFKSFRYAEVHVLQGSTDTSLMLMLSHSHRHHHHHRQRSTYSLHAPVRVCSFGIEAAIAIHASPSFCIAVTDDGTGDGADVDGAMVG